ncbi:esterase family protein [Synechococcus sp. A18-25c]|uniref:alpha/beta fold hydrolase n=1 Tax=unclassified Synechococcus TaxID=2626047 RepID=UPI001646AB8F|nr:MULTISPECIES: alpha/beta fold hydrolase [unclassified Synechococcus]QNI48506.1 esterase family protein [Synechococcus sp. A15-60]QNJ20136.1 esterase family protein [Synechococcus sp. A18-25c]
MAINRHSLEQVQRIPVQGGDVEIRLYQPHGEPERTRTPLLVTHGGPGGSSVGLYDALHALADQRPLIFYDQLGSFSSPAELLPEQRTLERFAFEPLQILNRLEIERTSLLGHSWGGSVMTQFCLNHPERVSALVLSSPLLSTRRWIEDCNALVDKIKSDLGKVADIDAEFERRHFSRNNQFINTLLAERRRSNTTLYNQMWGSSEFEHSGVLGNLDFFPSLNQISIPTLLICGEYDTATPRTLQEARDQIGTNAQLKVLLDAGHKTYIDNNADYIEVVKTFLDSGISLQERCPAFL